MLNRFEPSSSLKERVYETLKTEIITGGFRPGEQLNIVELATKMGISSAPVREALSMLEQNGFVVLMPRKKAIVAEVSLDDYSTMLDLRQMLEPYAAKKSTGRIPREQLAEMRKKLENVLANPDDMNDYSESDVALHDLMATYCGSRILSDLLKTIKEHSMRIRFCIEEMADQSSKREFVRTITQEHIAILQAWEREDADEAYEASLLHLKHYRLRSQSQGAIELFLESISKNPVQEPLPPAIKEDERI